MSRTYKDKPWKYVDPQSRWDYGYVRVPYEAVRSCYAYNERGEWLSTGEVETVTRYYNMEVAGIKTKKKRSYRERNWMTEPMWWVSEFMNQPQRARGREWERQVVKYAVEDIDDADTPSVSRKPHLYYW